MKFLIMSGLCVLFFTGCGDVTGPTSNAVKIAVYGGPGASNMEVTAMINMFEWMGYQVTETNGNMVLGSTLEKYDIIVFPGGSPETYAMELGTNGLQKIREYIENGGGYIGVCGGAMLACENAIWHGEPVQLDYLGIFDGDAKGPANAGTPGYWTMEEFDLVTEHPVCEGQPDPMWILFCGNPYFLPDKGSYKILKYAESGQCAMAGSPCGDGRVVVMGPMLMFEEDSDRDGVDTFDHLDDKGSDWPFMQRVTEWILED
ncbi:MAG: hypothetical protein KAR40_01720 [Candidatus Sabulitectum sp.]|nr:hypothetical protein [Candidatus Sabulitectum sp.]